ncbi:MAG TPA: ferredoxin reductase [Solirubrobacteraceae bacterium]|nr:ferredoxin reductase [Solirubrobacteraceae bacterium]
MERAALLERLSRGRAPIVWRTTTVREIVLETEHARTIVLDVPGWPGHVAGQHVDVRLTAEDGYQAERSYSIASAPESPSLSLTVVVFDDGEVSPYLAEELRVGDEFEVRGPVGGYFTWRVEDGGPLLLIAGGSGLVPLMAMLRHHAAQASAVPVSMLVSARSRDDTLYRDELATLSGHGGVEVSYTLTREQPRGWTGFARRVDAEMLTAVGPSPGDRPRVFVCGPTAFVESVADRLVELGHAPGAIRAERFGPTGE